MQISTACGTACGSAGSTSQSLFDTVRSLSAGKPVFTADYYAVDPVSGKVAALIDWSDPSHSVRQTSSSAQCAVPSPHADFGNKRALVFTGSETYVSTRAAASFAYLSDGTGSSVFVPMNVTSLAPSAEFQTFLSTKVTGAGTGYRLGANSVVAYTFTVYADAGVNVVSAASTLTVGSPMVAQTHYKEGAAPEYYLKRTGLAAVTGGTASTPSGNVTNTLTVGATFANTQFLKARVRSIITAPFLDDGARSAVHAYIKSDTGLNV